jgi:membrane protease YdiL (CAAX protease family)
MIGMFSIPKSYFVLGSIVSTSTMFLVALLLTKYSSLFNPSTKTVVIGIAMAFLLYFIFLGGNYLVKSVSPLGIGSQNENTIYSLFSTTPLPLKIIVFLLDAVGFESYFRGVLVPFFAKRTGIGAIFIVALIDALIHVSTFNPLFSVTTFIADSVWGLNYYITRDLYSNIATHFLWDMLVFVILPIS